MPESPAAPTWRPGDRLIVRGAPWTVRQSAVFADCEAVRLQGAHDGAPVTLLMPFDRPRRAQAVRRCRIARRGGWARAVRGILVESRPHGGLAHCPDGIRLLAYQLEPAIAMLRHGHSRVLLADEVGLGKTVQAGLVLRELAGADAGFRGLVLAPAGLRSQWTRELAHHFEIAPIDADAGWLRASARELPPDVNPWSLPGVYLASIDFVKRPEALRPLEDVRWDLLVVDEAHAAATGTDRRAGVHAAAVRARRVMLLTATPHEGDPAQFAALCRIGDTGHDPPPPVFRRTRGTVLGTPPRRSTLLPVAPTDAERRMHRLLEQYTDLVWQATSSRETCAQLASVILRKRALSSAASLAASVRRRLDLLSGTCLPAQLDLPLDDEEPLEDAPPEVPLAAPGLRDPALERRLLSAIADAADAAAGGESKIRALLRLFSRIDEPAIVFTEYRDTLERLRPLVAAAGHRVCLLHGGLSPRERRAAVETFGAGGTTLLATDAAAEGLNLQHGCRLVVHYELPWNPSRLEQRAGRVDRIGQFRRVHEIALVASDTAESLVLGPLARRAGRHTTRGAGTMAGRLTESRVAASILGHAPLDEPPDSPAGPAFAATDGGRFLAEAAAEAERLERRRRVAAARGPVRPDRARDVPVTLRRRRSPNRRALLIFDVRLSDGSGTVVEALPAAIVLALAGPRWPRETAAILRRLTRLLDRARAAIDLELDRVVNLRLGAVRAVRDAAVAGLRRRETAISRAQPSAAQELVQDGLFDGRARRTAVARRHKAAVLLEDSTVRAAALSAAQTLIADRELRAVLLDGGR